MVGLRFVWPGQLIAATGSTEMSTRRIRILHCHYTADPGGGSDRSLFELISNLPRNRFESALVLGVGDPLADAYRAMGLEVYEIKLVPPRRALDIRKFVRFCLNYITAVRRIRRTIGTFDPDVVHVNTLMNVQCARAAYRAKRPLVWHVRELMPQSWAYKTLTRRVEHWATKTVAISRAVAVPLKGCGDRLQVVPNAVDLDSVASGDGAAARRELGLPANAPVVTMAARLEPWKGQHILVEAAPAILQAYPSTHFVFAGAPATNKPSYAMALRSRCAELDLTGHTHFPGIWSDIPGLFAASTVVVAPSVTPEPFGRTLVEAMGAGCPVVATRAGGPLDIVVEGHTGLLVAPDDPKQLAAAVNGLLSAPERAAAMGGQGREIARARYGIGRLVQDMAALFDEVAFEIGIGSGSACP